jgi:hypothetical protein
MDACLAFEAQTNASRDHQQAINAFREKRKPDFRSGSNSSSASNGKR